MGEKNEKRKNYETTIRQRVECEKKAFHVVNKLIDGRVADYYLVECVERTILSKGEESRIVQWLGESARRGFGKTKSQVIATVQEVLKEDKRNTPFKDGKPGAKWYQLFTKRHAGEISKRTPQPLGSQRAGVTAEKIESWFETAQRDISNACPGILNEPNRIFNCDESGFQLGGGVCKVLAPKGDKHIYQYTNDTHRQITVLACGSASGEVHPPLLIFPGQRFGYNPLDGFPEAHFAKSPNGWIDSDIFAAWLKIAFIPAIEGLAKPVLLFVDGHKTHTNLTVSELCRDHNIILYQLPSHASHLVQPLDLTTFRSLKQAWREEVVNFQIEEGDVLGKRKFAQVFRKAWERGIKRDVVISGFRAAGIFPWNPDRFDRTKLGPCRLFTTTDTDEQQGQHTDVQGATDETTTETDFRVTEDNLIIPLSPKLNDPPVSPPQCPPNLPDLNVLILPEHPVSVSPPQCPPNLPDENLSENHNVSTSTCTPASQLSPAPPQPSQDFAPLSDSEALDRLLILTAKVGIDKFIYYRALHDTAIDTEDVEGRKICRLYRRLKCLTDKTGPLKDTPDKVTFGNLPLPTQKKKRLNTETCLTMPQTAPKMISSDEFRNFLKDKERDKIVVAEEKERKRKRAEEERERKKKEREEQKKRHQETRRKDQERKKKEREEKKQRQLERNNKRIQVKETKKTVTEDTSDDNDSLTSSECVESDPDMDCDMIDPNVCSGCFGLKDGEEFQWIGCDCGRWFHITCTKDERLQGRSMNELKDISFVCSVCVVMKCK